MIVVYSPSCLEYFEYGHPENPRRVSASVELLRQTKDLRWLTPQPCTEEDILRVHSRHTLQYLKLGTFIDDDTPRYPNILALAKLAAGAAILAAEQALSGHDAFSLMRPPGHHAKRHQMMGFCYLNHIAIAVAKLLANKDSGIERVAILDFDCHHGNGTENIFLGNSRVLFASVHQSPCYPGTGLTTRENCHNFPLAPRSEPNEFLHAVETALDRMNSFRPDFVAISAGFDAYKDDPLTDMTLEIESYFEIGKLIRSFSRAARSATPLPCFAVLEGGYSRDCPQCVAAFVRGWDERCNT